MAEIRANWLDGSSRLATGRSSTSSGRTFASAANVTGSSYLATQSCSRARAPDVPASSPAQLSGAVPPRGEDAPIPVTTIFLVITATLREKEQRRAQLERVRTRGRRLEVAPPARKSLAALRRPAP